MIFTIKAFDFNPAEKCKQRILHFYNLANTYETYLEHYLETVAGVESSKQSAWIVYVQIIASVIR